MQEIFSSEKTIRLDCQCNDCGTSELLESEKDVAKCILNHQGHIISVKPLKKKSQKNSRNVTEI